MPGRTCRWVRALWSYCGASADVPPVAPASTYRLQIRPGFDLYAASELCEYLSSLGVGALYLSPLLVAAAGSEHGYDVVSHQGIDAARGGREGWLHLLEAARTRGMTVVADIVPNHMGVGRAHENAAWWDVLRLGRDSRYAAWFDIDWSAGRVRLPVLGDDFDPSELRVTNDELHYFEHRFPLAPGTGPAEGESAADAHARQHYELVGFRQADAQQNYRRFFAVSTLAGLRVDDPEVFDATHGQIIRWVHDDGVRGLRVDHPDGLADPHDYLDRLRARVGPNVWITVEKILEPDEALPDWPVDGTTGYDALAEVNALLVDPTAVAELDTLYRELTGDQAGFADHVAACKREVASGMLRAEVNRLVTLACDVPHAGTALEELLVAFPVYRTYLPCSSADEHSRYLRVAASHARRARPELADTIDELVRRLYSGGELTVRFQQLSGAIMAKGVEDRAYYRYTRFVAANEVGGDPARPGSSPDQFHAAQQRRSDSWPRSMTTLSTHDTKRGEDVRARLAVLAELHTEWMRLARELMSAAPLPEPRIGYLLWQSFAGVGFIERERMHSYAEKAMRESGLVTNWVDPDNEFETQVHALVDRAYDDPSIRMPLTGFIERIRPYGWTNSLSQKLIQLTVPGVPDLYQGTELWEDTLVDPDNRRPVEFSDRQSLLAQLDAATGPPPIDASARAKLWIVSRALRLRRDRPELFTGYRAIHAHGPSAQHAVAFDRGGAITVATRLPVALDRAGGWADTVLPLEHAMTDVLTGRRCNPRVELRALFRHYPVALLIR